MKKISYFIAIVIFNGCTTVASNEIIKLDSQSITTESPNIIEAKLEATPFDIWERIRLELTLKIPEDQIASTSVYRERLYKNQSAVNRIIYFPFVVFSTLLTMERCLFLHLKRLHL